MDIPGLYFSANINRNEYHDLDAEGHLIPKSIAGELFASYNFGNGITPYFSYNARSTDDYVIVTGETAKYNQQIFVLGALYTWDDVILMYIEGRSDAGDYKLDGKTTDGDNAAAVGLRYTF